MSLFIDGSPLTDIETTLGSYKEFLKAYRSYFENGAEELKKSTHKNVTPKDVALYVNQMEYAVLTANDTSKITKFGTDMATTCHMVVVRCPKTKVTSLGHFDGHGTAESVNDLINDTIKESQQKESEDGDDNKSVVELDLHIIGGFDDDRKLSEKLSLELIKEFNNFNHSKDLAVRFHLKTFCATALNTTERSVIVAESYTTSRGRPGGFVGDVTFDAPHIYGILVDVLTGDICQATFSDEAKLPVPDLRGARSMSGCRKMSSVYRPKENCFVVEPFSSKPWPGIERWLHQTDENIRWNLSTSPEAEPKNFEAHIRGILQFMHRNSDPMKSVFADNKPLLFDAVITDCGLEWVQRK